MVIQPNKRILEESDRKEAGTEESWKKLARKQLFKGG